MEPIDDSVVVRNDRGRLAFDLTHVRRPRWNLICAIASRVTTLSQRGHAVRAIAPLRVRPLLESAGLSPALIDSSTT